MNWDEINHTKLIFNQKFKDTISYVRDIYVSPGELIDVDCANKLREYLKNDADLDVSKLGAYNMADTYAFVICLCFNQETIQNCDNWFDLTKELQKCHRLDEDETEKYFEQSNYDHCACGHKIQEVWIFEGEYTKAVVGSICITKSVITNDTVKNKLKKHKSTKTKYARRMKKDKTEDWFKSKSHVRCLGSKEYEICSVLIDKVDASWKKRCRECHTLFNNPISENRQCLECQLPIFKSEPAYKVRCYECHSKHKSK
tara:strand:+ start:870 stop:1640 length:771 start_codon:yes stop_codon:yes gene_type:complete